jgi:hypothetical protein
MYKVYWTAKNGAVHDLFFTELSDALNHAKYARDSGGTFVCMVSENPDVVGKQGVDGIVDGVLPCGNAYEWKKRR